MEVLFVEQKVFVSKQAYAENGLQTETIQVGDYIACEIVEGGKGTHIVKPLYKTSLQEYSKMIGN